MTWWHCCCSTVFPSLTDCNDCTQTVPTSATLTFTEVDETACGPTRCTHELPSQQPNTGACCRYRNHYFCEACCVQIDGAHAGLATNIGGSGCGTGTLAADFRPYICHNDDEGLGECPGSCCTDSPPGDNCRPDADCADSVSLINLELIASPPAWRVSVYEPDLPNTDFASANAFAFVGYQPITAGTCYDDFSVGNTLGSCQCYHNRRAWCNHPQMPVQPAVRMATGGSCSVVFVP